MSLTRAVVSTLRCCNGCRSAIATSFASRADINSLNPNRSLSIPAKPSRNISRSFATSLRCFSFKETRTEELAPEADSKEEGVGLAERRPGDNESNYEDELLNELDDTPLEAEQPDAQGNSVPWYLQNRAPSFESAAPDTSHQQLPDLPPNPPPILQNLLEHLSVQLGLDDLTLLDLRHLDPPPALGSKLIMLIGTARSEKHLHVSADRFCRWLRSTYKLRPHAAGLLGRNELKLKLRRKARRLKMLANAGGADPGKSLDDGIRTGWICCTVGRVDPHTDDRNLEPPIENFIGFGRRTDGVNVVVQMFTEEKRLETDLETLWGGVLRTAAREKGITDEELASEEEEISSAKRLIQQQDAPRARSSEKEVDEASRTRDEGFNRVSESQRNPQSASLWPESTPSDVFPSLETRPSGPRQRVRNLHTVGFRRHL